MVALGRKEAVSEAARQYLKDNPETTAGLAAALRSALGIPGAAPAESAPASAKPPLFALAESTAEKPARRAQTA